MPPWKTGLIVLSVMISSAIISVVELRKVIGQHREPWQAATLCVTLATLLDARARNPSQHQDDDLYRPTRVALHLGSNTCRIQKIKLRTGQTISLAKHRQLRNAFVHTQVQISQRSPRSVAQFFPLSFRSLLLFTYRNGSGGNHYWQNHRPCVPELRHFKTVDRFTGPWDSTRA